MFRRSNMRFIAFLGTVAFLIFSRTCAQDADGPILTVPGIGTLRGGHGKSAWTDRPFFTFQGIPFGKPPIGERRFLPAEPADFLGEEEFNATGFGHKCPQLSLTDLVLPQNDEFDLKDRMAGNEDCLNLNVYTPNLNNSEPLLPVMFFIYGGAYILGETTYYLPGKIMEKDVVLVTVNYRLGALGFLSLDVDEAPGNAGLFDQLLGLQWVHDHIEAFGGDPEKVTIWGESAGAASVAYHLLSPLSKGLFRSAIIESGAAITPWAQLPTLVQQSQKFADKMNCTYPGASETARCLKEIDASVLVSNSNSLWTPSVQKAGELRFLEEDPAQLLQRGDFNHVPAIFGANRNEGSMFLSMFYKITENNAIWNDTDFLKNDAIPTILYTNSIKDPTRAVTDAVYERYLGDVNFDNLDEVAAGFVDIFSVFYLKACTYRTMQHNSRYNNTYWYAFNFDGRFSLYTYLSVVVNAPHVKGGIAHGDELMYLLAPTPLPLNKEERAVSERMVSLWTNFAIYGNPTPEGESVEGVSEWPAYDVDKEQYLDINVNFTIMNDYTKTYNTRNPPV